MIEVKNKWALGGIFLTVGGAFVGLAVWLSPGQPAEQAPPVERAGQVDQVDSDAPSTPSTAPGTATSSPDASGVGGGENPATGQVQANEEPPPVAEEPPTTDPGQTVPPAAGQPPPVQNTPTPPPNLCTLPGGGQVPCEDWHPGQ